MLFWHLLIGVGEGAITLLVVSYVKKTRPEILFGEG
jgi:cobalt/nickel transport system permease protein